MNPLISSVKLMSFLTVQNPASPPPNAEAKQPINTAEHRPDIGAFQHVYLMGKAVQDLPILDMFADTEKKSTETGVYYDSWKPVFEAEEQPLLSLTSAELEAKIKGARQAEQASSWGQLLDYWQPVGSHSEDLLKLLNTLAMPSQSQNHLAHILERHGARTLDQISAEMLDYWQSAASPPGIKQEIIQDLLHDLAFPSDIDQRNRSVCSAATVHMKLAIESPLTLVKMVSILAQSKSYPLPNGDWLQPNLSWVGDRQDTRSRSSKVLQNALMGLAWEGVFSDTEYDSSQNETNGGVSGFEQARVLRKVFGEKDYQSDLLAGPKTLMRLIEDDLARGRSVSLGFEAHFVLVVGLDKTGDEPLVILNSWGTQYAVSLRDLLPYIHDVQTQDDAGWDNRKIQAGTRFILGDHAA